MIMFKIVALSLLLVTVGRSARADRSCKVTDLSWPFNSETVYWGNSDGFQFINQIAIEEPNGDWFAMNDFKTSEHGGTHIDAPYLFVKYGWKVGDIPLRHLMGSGIKIDLSRESSRNAVLLPRHLIEWERQYGRIPEDSIILVYFNWSRYYHNKTDYVGGPDPSQYKFPGVSDAAAEWIVNNRKIFGIGIDTASIDPGQNIALTAHKIFLKKNIYHLENVKIPMFLPAKNFKLVVMPMYIQEGTGAPARIVAYSKGCWKNL